MNSILGIKFMFNDYSLKKGDESFERRECKNSQI